MATFVERGLGHCLDTGPETQSYDLAAADGDTEREAGAKRQRERQRKRQTERESWKATDKAARSNPKHANTDHSRPAVSGNGTTSWETNR